MGLSPEGLVVEQGSKKEVIRSKVFIGADGVHSSIARSVGRSPLKTIVGLQYEVVMPGTSEPCRYFLPQRLRRRICLVFPKREDSQCRRWSDSLKKQIFLHELMDHFLDHLVESKKLPGIEIVAKTGGSIPCGKPRQTVFGNTLLVGDAAGHAHPITGAGILNAVIGGEMAGRIAAEAIDRGDLQYLENYEMEWRETFGKSLSYGALKREFLEENWNKSEVDFEGLIRKTWVGFKEYYKERKNSRA